MTDRAELADFLRARRDALRPEDLGLWPGHRRRAPGLRREEVAVLSGVSTDYYSRIEQRRGPLPSAQVLSAIAGALRLSARERDHLLGLAGHLAPHDAAPDQDVSLGMASVLDRMADIPAHVENVLGETLMQTRPAAELLGDETSFTGLARSRVYRWFTDPAARAMFPEQDHAHHGRALTAQLAEVQGRVGKNSPAGVLVAALRDNSSEFRQIWEEHPIPEPYCESKRIVQPMAGLIELRGEVLHDPGHSQMLIIFTAVPGSESDDKLRMLAAAVMPFRVIAG